MIIGFQTPDRLLYHYTSIENAKDYILKNRTLKFGAISQTNDPKETKNWRFTLHTMGSSDLSRHDLQDLSARFTSALKSRTKVVCFSRDSQPLSGDHTRDIFQRGWSKSRMWAQYAAKHTGVCLVFERQKLDHQVCRAFGFDAILYRGDVAYVNRSLLPHWHEGDFVINVDHLEKIGFERYVNAHFRTYVRQLFFEKMVDWRDEAEFRWIGIAPSEADVFVNISDSLVGVLFGDSAREADIKAIIEMTEDIRLEYMGLKWSNSTPWYDFGNFIYNSEWRRLQKAKSAA